MSAGVSKISKRITSGSKFMPLLRMLERLALWATANTGYREIIESGQK